MLRYDVAEMKHRLATSDLLREAEKMGFDVSITLPRDSAKPISNDPRYKRVCPKCRAAIGAPCTEPVRDGMKFINEVHKERLDGTNRGVKEDDRIVDADIAGDESD